MFSLNKQEIDLYFLGFFLSLAIVNAFIVNILKIQIPFFTIIIIGLTLLLFFRQFKFKSIKFNLAKIMIVIIICYLFILFVIYLFLEHNYSKEILYHMNALIFMFYAMTVTQYSNYSPLKRKNNQKIYFFTIVLLLYVAISGLNYIFFWEEIAVIFSKNDTLLNLKMDGDINRMYGLLFNPLSQAFSFFYLMLFMYELKVLSKRFILLILIIIAMSFVRTVYILTFLFFMYILLIQKRYFILGLLITIIGYAIGSSEEIQTILIEIVTFSDNTGSADEHFRNIRIGYESAISLVGHGFNDSMQSGAWNIRLEGWIWQYSYVYGAPGFIAVLLLHLIIFVRAFIHRDSDSIVVVTLLFLSNLLFPIYTLQFAFFLYMLLLMHLVSKTYKVYPRRHLCSV